MQRNLPIINVAKYVASICVVAVHTFTTSPIDNIYIFLFIQGIARLAVPFFFCCTGYFIGSNGIGDKDVVIPYIKKLIGIYLFWSIIYIPIEILKMIGTNTLNISNILNYLKFILVQGSFLHLWYFPAIILAIFILHKLMKKASLWTVSILACIIYAIGMLGDSYYGILTYLPEYINNAMNLYLNIFISTRNGLFFGFPFVLIGIIISKYESKIIKMNFFPWLIISLISVCIEVYVLNIYNLAIDYNITLTIAPATFFLFLSLIQTQLNFYHCTDVFRKYSSLIYESHLIFYGIVLGLLDFYEINILNDSFVQFIVVFTLSQLFAYIAIKLPKIV